MEDIDDSGLSIGFSIDFRDSFGQLRTLDDLVGEAAASMFRQMQDMERATGMPIDALRNLAQETRAFTRERNAAERNGERLSQQLQREIDNFGKSSAEIKANKVATAALASEKLGLTEQAGRLRDQLESLQASQRAVAAAAEADAQAIREAAFAHQMFEARVREGVTAMRQQEAAVRAKAAADADLAARAQRLIAEINPAAAAQQRFNAEMAEARTLISAGAISLDDYVEKLRIERAALAASAAGHTRGAASAAAHNQAMLGVSYQVQDFITQVSMGANPINAFAVQGAQLAGQFANVGGKAEAVARFFMGPWGLALTGAVMLVGMFSKGMGEGADAANNLKLKLDVQKSSYDALVASVREYNDSQRNSTELTYAAAKAAQEKAIELVKQAKAELAAADAAFFAQSANSKGGAEIKAGLGMQADAAQARLTKLREDLREVEKAIANQEVAAALNRETAITNRYGEALRKLEIAYDSGRKSVSEYRTERERLLKLQEKELDLYREAKRETGAQGTTFAARDARVGDMVALIKQLFPGARITSTTGGQHAKGSDHYAGRAIDFVPGGGMGQYTTAEVEQILKNAGVDIRRNRTGTQQLFGPGRGASKPGDHNDHFHVAWQGSPDTSKVDEQKARALEEAKRAYDLTVKAAQDYAATQLDEAAKTGLSAKQLRAYADAAAIAKAPTDALKQSIRDAAAAREKSIDAKSATDFQANVMQPLRDELALYGLVGPARAAAALELEKEAFLAKNMGDGIAVATARWEEYRTAKLAIIGKDAAAEREAENIRRMHEEFEAVITVAQAAGDAIAHAFGRGGQAIGDALNILVTYQQQERALAEQAKKDGWDQARIRRENSQLALEGTTALLGASKNLFREGAAGYKAMAAAEKAFALVQLANTAVNVAAGAARMFAMLGPWAFPAVAAMIGVMASLGFSSGGKSKQPAATNDGSGTVLGDSQAKSESITRAINQLRDIDTIMLSYSRQMADSLRSIDNQIGGAASLIVRNPEGITSNSNIKEGFNSNAGTVLAGVGGALFGVVGAGIGALLTKIPIVGDVLKSLFGSKTTILGSGLYGGSQSLGSILDGGYDTQTFVDVQKKKKLFGITTSNKTSTQYGAVDPALEQQFTLILRSFNDAILAAAGPLGIATTEIQQRLNSFVFSLGKVDLKGLTGEQIEEKLTAVFGAAADNMARSAFPGIAAFQKAGEGLFETLVRVSSTVEAVGASLDLLGNSAQGMSLATKLALADQFDSVGDLTNAASQYFSLFYSREEQAAARAAQMATVFQSLGVAMPSSLAAFRSLVEAQNLNTEAGRSVYATLLQLAPAFADLQSAMAGAKSAADIATERQDLERQLLELRGDTAALRALQLAKLDASNRALQQEIWAVQDAQAAAKAAQDLADAWKSAGDSIMDEVRRIRGLNDATGAGTYAALLGQFNAATGQARGGDIDAAKSLPQLSQALLAAAQDSATSRQELDRIRAMIAANLEQTNALIGATGVGTPTTNAALLNAGLFSQPTSGATNDNGAAASQLRAELTEKLEQMRKEQNAALATIAANTGRVAKKLDDVTTQSGGDAITTEARQAAA
ncbi:MAG: hypothetical protein JNM03_09735 [Sphingopyxis sp.]|uniref:hypothetical protein n=1 Tax=Sphingopyxis sp. TaxID=1908224 RepID=UPI001A559CF9|nr:hypothetical protein [Sphingopyxis sp.]MBL9070258.1 hypothetical protein [Sphingopyxis sp.]